MKPTAAKPTPSLTTKLVLGLLLIFVSFMSVADLLYRPGHPVTFDGHIHMTTMNQFAQSLYDWEFPVTWSNNFANYGHPLPLIAHQLPAYLGALLILAGVSTELAFILLLVLSIILASFLSYSFFRKFADQKLAFATTVFSVFFPYRALNIYTRGGLPEVMATVFLPVLLLGVWNLQQKRYRAAALLLYLGTLGTALTHPMMLVIFAIPVGVYFLYILYTSFSIGQITSHQKNLAMRKALLHDKTLRRSISIALLSFGLGLVSASYYLLPLFAEMKYFYQARMAKGLASDSFLTVKQLYDPTWFYTFTHPGPRGNYISLGTIEFVVLSCAVLFLLLLYLLRASQKYSKLNLPSVLFFRLLELKKAVQKILSNQTHLHSLLLWTGTSVLLVLLLLPISRVLYTLPLLDRIQYPWRFLTALQITIPLVFLFLVQAIKKLNNAFFLLFFSAIIMCYRVPQFYGKNYIVQPESDYYFTQTNLHSTNFNTIWSGDSEEYDRKTVQAEIIAGNGELTIIEEKNASRTYQTQSETELRVVDYTFYFPGWNVYIDSIPTVIEYQDIDYRGLITYTVPAGSHEVTLKYEYTKVRLLALLLTVGGIGASALLYALLRSKYLKPHQPI